MPPKSQKAGGGKASAATDITKMTKEQLEVYSAKLIEELEREREERNYFQLERDNIQTFWDVTRQQLQEARSHNRVLKKEAQDFTKKFEHEALQSRKKFAHLVHSYQTEAASNNVEHLVALKKFQNHFIQKKMEIIQHHNSAMKVQLEANLSSIWQNQVNKLEHRKSLEEAKQEFRQDTLELQNRYDGKIAAYRKDFSLKHNVEIAEVEERKNEHVDQLLKEHELAYQELKSFYNNILLNNLAVIEGLKKKFSQVKKNEVRMMGQLKEKLWLSFDVESEMVHVEVFCYLPSASSELQSEFGHDYTRPLRFYTAKKIFKFDLLCWIGVDKNFKNMKTNKIKHFSLIYGIFITNNSQLDTV